MHIRPMFTFRKTCIFASCFLNDMPYWDDVISCYSHMLRWNNNINLTFHNDEVRLWIVTPVFRHSPIRLTQAIGELMEVPPTLNNTINNPASWTNFSSLLVGTLW
jgi:hypothetical protein